MSQNHVFKALCCLSVLISYISGATAVERIYVVSTDGYLTALDGLPVGNSGFGQSGDTTFLDLATGIPDLRAMDTGDNGEVLVGGDGLHLYDSNLNLVKNGGPLNDNGNGVTALEIGNLGPGNYVVVAHDLPQLGPGCFGAPGGGCSQLLFFDDSLNAITANPIPNFGTARSIEFGNLSDHALYPGTEVAIAGHYENHATSSRTAPGDVGFVVMFNFNGTNPPSFPVTQHPFDHSIGDLAIGDLFGGTNEAFAITGSQTEGNPAMGPTPLGQGTWAFSDGAGVSLQWQNNLAAPAGTPPAGLTMKAVVIADVMSNPGNEVIAIGNNVLRIFDGQVMAPEGNTPPMQEISLNMDGVELAVGDVLRGDGVDEIVVVTSGGMILALEHETPGDLSSPFALNPGSSIGAAFDTGGRDLRAVEILPLAGVGGDYNDNGTVDAADYTLYQDLFGQAVTLSNENPAATTPGLVDKEDYDYWVSRFGATSGVGTATGSVPVPELSTCGLVLVGSVLLVGWRRHR